MPELPEVEAVVRSLATGGRGGASILGRTVASAAVPSSRILQRGASRLDTDVVGAVLERVTRRGKYIVVHLSRAMLVLHLRMTGDLLVVDSARPPARHERLRLTLSGGQALVFDDPRHLGQAWIVDDAEELLHDIAPDPLDDALDATLLRERLGHGQRTVKAALLDQRTISGVGNIWADEALHRAKLHPTTPVSALSDDDAAQLLTSLRAALEEGVAELVEGGIQWVYRGARDVTPPGRVHGRGGQPCPACGAVLEKTRVAGRGTVSCPRCQPVVTARGERPPGARPRRPARS